MKTMQNFAAQQLSKKEMNEVRGGMVKVKCSFINKAGEIRTVKTKAETWEVAAKGMQAMRGEGEEYLDCKVSGL